MKYVYKLNNIIVRLEEIMIAASVLIMSITLIANVLYRLFADKSIYAAEEIGQYCIYIITFIGLSYAVTTGKHINMLGLFDMAPEKFRKVDAIIIALVTCVTMCILTWIGMGYVETLKLMGRVSVVLRIPTYYVVAVITMGFVFAALQYLLILIKNLTHKEVYLGLNEVYVPDFRREAKK